MNEPDPEHRVIRLGNRLDELSRLHTFVAQFCSTRRLAPDDSFALSLAIDELVTNIIVYGYDDLTEHEIVLALSMAGDAIVVEMEDDARPFDPTQGPAVDLSADPQDREIGGLGLHFVQRTMDEMLYRRSGGRNHLLMKKRTAQR